MDNPETLVTLGTQEKTTQKTKKMRNTDPTETKKPSWTQVQSKG